MIIPNSLLIVAAAKLRAEEEDKKIDALPSEGGEPAVPGLSEPSPMNPITSTFQVGMAVREILSGRTGKVVEGPQGDYGDLTFMMADDDGKTYPIPSDQLEVLSPAASAPMAPPATELPPVPAAGAEAGATPPPTAEEMATKASLERIVSDSADSRKITYAKVLEASKPTVSASKLLSLFGYVPETWDAIVADLTKDGVLVLRSAAKPNLANMVKAGLTDTEILLDVCATNGPVRESTLTELKAMQVAAGPREAVPDLSNARKDLGKAAMRSGENNVGEAAVHSKDADARLKSAEDLIKARRNLFVMKAARIKAGPHEAEARFKKAREFATTAMERAEANNAPGASRSAEAARIWRNSADKELHASGNLIVAKSDDGREFVMEVSAGKPTVPMPSDAAPSGMVYAWDDAGKKWYLTAVTPGGPTAATPSTV